MREIADMTRHIVERAKKYEHDTIPGDFGVLKVPCPKCGGEIHEKYKQFQCEKCDFALWKTVAGRMFEIEEVEKLITEKQIGPLQGFRSKQGWPFAAVLKMNAEFKLEFDFGNDQNDNGEAAAPVDFTGKEPLGKCPEMRRAGFRRRDELRLRKGDGRGARRAISAPAKSFCSRKSRRSR